jgi:hypothetical protein
MTAERVNRMADIFVTAGFAIGVGLRLVIIEQKPHRLAD